MVPVHLKHTYGNWVLSLQRKPPRCKHTRWHNRTSPLATVRWYPLWHPKPGSAPLPPHWAAALGEPEHRVAVGSVEAEMSLRPPPTTMLGQQKLTRKSMKNKVNKTLKRYPQRQLFATLQTRYFTAASLTKLECIKLAWKANQPWISYHDQMCQHNARQESTHNYRLEITGNMPSE